jgi:hypothetical protein
LFLERRNDVRVEVTDREGDIEVFVAPSATDVDPNATMHNMKENAKEAPNDIGMKKNR